MFLEIRLRRRLQRPPRPPDVHQLTRTDIDPLFVADAVTAALGVELRCLRFTIFSRARCLANSTPSYTLDVLEHVTRNREGVFLANATATLAPGGVMIVGHPSIESPSLFQADHRNRPYQLEDSGGLESLDGQIFHHVFMFSNDDEVVHSGYAKLAHYIIALCCGLKTPRDWDETLR